MDVSRKVYARQVPWEWQESPWDDEQLKTDKAALYGNRSYGRYVFDEFEQVVKALEEMDWDDVGAARPYSTEQEMLLDYVPPVGRDSYTDEEIKTWKFASQMYNPNYGRNEQWGICMGLTLMLGKEYDYKPCAAPAKAIGFTSSIRPTCTMTKRFAASKRSSSIPARNG